MTVISIDEILTKLEQQIVGENAAEKTNVARHFYPLIAAADLESLPSSFVLGKDLLIGDDDLLFDNVPL